MLQAIKNFVGYVRSTFQYGPVAALFSIFQGRATTFSIAFGVVGVYGFLHHYDLGQFTAFVVAIQGLVFAHSIKEDYFSIQPKSGTSAKDEEVSQ